MTRDEFWFWFGVWTSILMLAGAGTVINFSDWFAPELALKIAKACMACAAINNVILTAAKYRGYMNAKIAAALPDASKVAGILIAAFVLSLFLAGNLAHAEMRKPAVTGNIAADIKTDLANGAPASNAPVLTGNIEKDAQALWGKIQGLTKADITYAIAKAKAANTNAANIRLQCLQAISDANDQANGISLSGPDGTPLVRPDPAMVTTIEDIAELIDNLSPQGKLFTSCAGAAQMFKTNTLAAINAIVTGAAGIALLPAGL